VLLAGKAGLSAPKNDRRSRGSMPGGPAILALLARRLNVTAHATSTTAALQTRRSNEEKLLSSV